MTENNALKKAEKLGRDYNFCYVCGCAMKKETIEEIGEWWVCPECGALDEIVVG